MEIKTSIQAETLDNLQALDRRIEYCRIVKPANVFCSVHFDTSQPLCFPCFSAGLLEIRCFFHRQNHLRGVLYVGRSITTNPAVDLALLSNLSS